jgi:hypothetical protein
MKINKEIALLYGIMLGDGCLCKCVDKKGKTCYFISISGNYYDDKPFYDSIVIPLINRLRNDKKTKYRNRKNYGKIEVNFSDKILFNKLEEVGFPVGKKGNGLEIPKIFYNKKLLKYIIRGFFATDGSIVLTKNPNKFYPRLEAHGISPKLISQIKDYLLNIGLKGHFYECKRRKKFSLGKNFQTQYRFQFNGKENFLLFENLIGFVNSKQKEKFLHFIDYDKEYSKKMKGIPTQKQKLFRDKIKL